MGTFRCCLLVFFMQAGFAMVETGFTRAKNASNIDYEKPDGLCIGTLHSGSSDSESCSEPETILPGKDR